MNDKKEVNTEIVEGEFANILEYVTPLSDKRRIGRCLEYAKRDKNITTKGLEAVLDLKNRCRYPFIQSMLFPGQLRGRLQPHVFKMSVRGLGSGVDLINRMRPGGNLQEMWVHFDHVHRVFGWPTMSAHVYDPFVCSILTIATCGFKVEDHFAPIEFWKMLNSVVQENGFRKPEFWGFMANEANANCLAVHAVYFGGAKKRHLKKRGVVLSIGSRAWFAIHVSVSVLHFKRTISACVESGKMHHRKWLQKIARMKLENFGILVMQSRVRSHHWKLGLLGGM